MGEAGKPKAPKAVNEQDCALCVRSDGYYRGWWCREWRAKPATLPRGRFHPSPTAAEQRAPQMARMKLAGLLALISAGGE